MEWSELLREARQRAGLSQARLAARAGTTQSAVARYEAGAVSPTVATLDRLLAAAGVRARVSLEPIDPQLLDQLRAQLRRTPEQRIRRMLEAGAHLAPLRGAAHAR